jgi:hypothetical protein
VYCPFVITKEAMQRHEMRLGEDVQNARRGLEHFQIGGKNCCASVIMQAQEVHGVARIPHLFSMDVLACTPSPPLGGVFSWLRDRSPLVVMLTIWMVGVLLCVILRGMIIRKNGVHRYTSMLNTNIFWNRQIYNASGAFSNVLEQRVKGSIRYGHGEES